MKNIKNRASATRRHILSELEQAGTAMSAYVLMDRLQAQHGVRCVPVTIYQALKAFVAQGLVRYLPAQKKYMRTQVKAREQDFVLILHCRQCSTVTERVAPKVRSALATTGMSLRCDSVALDALCTVCG